LRRGYRVASDERLVELLRPAEPRLYRIGGLVDVVPVQRETRLEPERVPRAEADGDDAGRRAGREQPRPDLGGPVVVDEDLEAVLARVPGPGHDRARSGQPGAGH